MKKMFFVLYVCIATVLPMCAVEETFITMPEEDSKVETNEVLKPAPLGSVFSKKLKKDQIYSLGNKVESKKYATAGVEVITSEDIKNQGSPVLAELLNGLNGVTVQRTGSVGDITSFRMRGTDRVKVTLDGINVVSPNSLDHRFNAQHWLSDDLERIEVVRGPQGTVQGAQASGGLVGLLTKQGRGTGTFTTNTDFGSFGLFKEHMSYGMGDEKKDFYLGTTFLRTDGGSTIDDGQGRHERIFNDGYKNFGLVSNAGLRVLEGKGELRQIFRFNSARKELGFNGYGAYHDFNDHGTDLGISSTTIFNHAPNEWYDSSTRFGIVHDRYNVWNMPDSDNPSDTYDSHGYNRGTRLNFITQHNFNYRNWNRLSVGYNMEYTDYKGFSSEEDWMAPGSYLIDKWRGESVQNDVFVSDTINIKDKLFLKGGVRAINHNIFGSYFTPNASAALVLPTFKLANSYSKLRGSWGQSVSMPSFYQMYGKLTSMYQEGNPGLRPEQLDGWDIGFEQSFFNDKLSLELGYFNNKYKDYIGWVDADVDWMTWPPAVNRPATYVNVNEAKISGWEAGIKWQPNHIFKVALNYTFSDSRDLSTNYELVGTPKNRVNVGMFITPSERFNFFVKADASGDRVCGYEYGTGEPRRVNGFVDVSTGARVKLFSYKKMHVFLAGTVYNLLNQNMSMFQDSNGISYYQPGVHYRLGVQVEFRGLGETL